MLADIRNKLKPNGILYIDEALQKRNLYNYIAFALNQCLQMQKQLLCLQKMDVNM